MISFGTDGWRALIAQDYTFENVAKCAQGVAEYINQNDGLPKSIVVGYDTRFLSAQFATRVTQVLVSNGIKVFWIDSPTPTPVITYMITHYGAGGGIIITASHNPYDWNGFKFKSHIGGSASQEIIDQIERYANSANPSGNLVDLENTDLIEYIPAKKVYTDHVNTIVDITSVKNANLNVLVDCMYGSGIDYLTDILSGSSTQITQIHNNINPSFPGIGHPEPIRQNLVELMNEVNSDVMIDLGLAFDGDADRIGLIDEQGRYISTLDSFSLLVYYFLAYKNYRGAIVKSITHSDMINKLCNAYNVEVYETAVGFKNLGPKMIATNAVLAGEESGGFAFRDSVPERDGILSALYLLEFVANTGRNCSDLLEELYQIVGPHVYSRTDIVLNEEQRNKITLFDAASIPMETFPIKINQINTVDGVKLIGDAGWVAYRLSGTEPLLRIYSESDSQQSVDSLIDHVRTVLGV